MPIDEEHPLRPHSSYSLSKVIGEEMARQFARWSHIPFIGLRFSAIREPAEYDAFPDAWSDPHAGEWNVWGYVDARDVGQACRLALTADVGGAEVFIIAAADTAMDRPNAELMADVLPVGRRCGRGPATSTRCSRSTRPAASWATSPAIRGGTRVAGRSAAGATRADRG